MEDLQIQRGNPFSASITITDDSVTPAVPYDLTGLTVFIAVKHLGDNLDDDTAAFISSEITAHITPESGITEWVLTALETKLAPGRYKADVRVYTNENVFINSDTFFIEIIPIVTKRIT